MTTMPLGPNTLKTAKVGSQGLMHSIASTRPSSTCLRRNLHDGATCTTRLENPSQTCFHVKQAARSRRVSRVDLPPSVLWRNRQTEAHMVLRPKPRNCHGDFEAQITKPELPVLRPKPRTLHHLGFEAQPRNRPPVLRPNQEKPSPPVLRPNQSQTVDLAFKAQPRNPHFSSPHTWCRPHTVPPDLSIARPPSTQPVRPSPVLCTRSPTPATILIAACHAAPATYTP
jgi:hypothetical protein